MKKTIVLTIISFLFVSCAKMKTIGKKEHSFNAPINKIVWLQIAGFELEHLSLLRFSRQNSSELLSMEKASCLGNAWSYNLYDLRPSAIRSFTGQIVGSANISGECKDIAKPPLWSYLKSFDYKTVILESLTDDKQSLSFYRNCEEFNQFIKGASLIKMAHSTSSELKYHFQESTALEPGKIYFDKSCDEKKCHSSLYSNVVSLWKNTFKGKEKSLLIVRDYSYADYIKKGNIVRAQEVLTDMERLYSFFSQIGGQDLQLLVTSAESLKLNFPKKGKEWLGYINNRNSLIRRSSLLSSVLAEGARSENFCGVYNEAEVMERVLWAPEERKYLQKLFEIQ